MNLNRAIPIMALAVAASLLLAWAGCGEWEEADTGGMYAAKEGLRIDHSAIDALDLSIDVSTASLYEAELHGRTFSMFDMKGASYLGEPGTPAIPFFSVMFAIPQGADVHVEVIEGEAAQYTNVLLAPMQPPAPDTEGVPDPEFAYDAEAYQSGALFPENSFFLEDEKIIRGLRVNQLWVSPVRYDPASGTMRLVSNLEVKISFSGGESHFFADPTLRSEAFDRSFERFIANFASVEPAPVINFSSEEEAPGKFLIITHPDFIEAANMLADWKLRMGITCTVVTTEHIGNQTADIQAYIADSYYSRTNPLEYVMIIGDADFVPTKYGSFHMSHFSRTGSDHNYVTLDGDDYYADLAIGRLPVDTAEQALDRVDKIIKYQQAHVREHYFYKSSYQFAYFQDSDDNGIADRRFALTSEEIYRWFNEVLTGNEIISNRCYVTSPDDDPQRWNQSTYAFFAEWWKWGRSEIPDELKRSNGFAWQCDEYDIAAALNHGTNFATHRDHGSVSGWADPYFRSENVMKLVNGYMTPVLFSINCQNGWFDNETDSIIDFTGGGELAFAEAWMRNLKGGAAGLISATRVSYSGFNDRLVWGWMDAVWPGYIDGYAPQEKEGQPAPALGDVVNYGKLYMSTEYGPSSTRRIAVEEFQWFGDPTMKMWTGVPKEFPLALSDYLAWNSTYVPLTLEIEGALVVLTLGSNMVGSATTTLGETQVPLNVHLEDAMTIEVTITKDGYRPYMKTMTVSQCGIDDDCQDGVYCNGNETCDQGACIDGEPVICNDTLYCNGLEICDESEQTCATTGAPCPAGFVCNEESDYCEEPESDPGEVCGF